MADYDVAFNYLMADEDSGETGEVVPDPTQADPQAKARFGINSHWNPEAASEGFYEMSKADALVWVHSFYKYRFFAAILGYGIACQDIANKYFDLAVNMGVEEATKIVQRACNQVASPVTVGYLRLAIDGIPGNATLAAINAIAPEVLLPAIKSNAHDFYITVAARLKWPAPQLKAMLQRANR